MLSELALMFLHTFLSSLKAELGVNPKQANSALTLTSPTPWPHPCDNHIEGTFFCHMLVRCSLRTLCAARPGDELGGVGSILPMRERGGVHVRLPGCHVLRGVM